MIAASFPLAMTFFGTRSNDYGMLLLRVCAALAMLPYGIGKTDLLVDGSYGQTVQFFAGSGIPWIVTILVIIAETVGAVSLILGFCTRFCAAALMVVMAGAVHFVFGMGYMTGYATPLLFLIAFLPLVINGAGAWSIDGLIAKKRR